MDDERAVEGREGVWCEEDVWRGRECGVREMCGGEGVWCEGDVWRGGSVV